MRFDRGFLGMAEPGEALRHLAALLRDGDTPISAHVVESGEEPEHGLLAAAGPRAAADPGEYALVVEAALPGIKPEDVQITVEDGTLSIWGVR